MGLICLECDFTIQIFNFQFFSYLCKSISGDYVVILCNGKVLEWLKRPAWKASKR